MNKVMSQKKTYENLFTPGKIGNVEIKNRIVKASQSSGLSNLDGTVSERLVRHYKELARGGTGLVMVEYTYIDNEASKSAYCQLGISNTEHISGLSWLVSSIKDEGAKAGLQIEHCGRQKFLGTPPIKAPSRIPWPALYEQTGTVPEELTIDEIKQIIEDFGHAAKRAETAGFDLVEIHAAHGYLITNFLSTHTNKRTDLYGGSLENRMRFLVEVIQTIKSKVSPDFPITMRINGTDYQPDGIKIEETLEVCKRAEQLGIQAIHVSGGDHHMMNFQVTPMTIPNGPNVWAADAIRQCVSIPVIASGSITTPGFAESILEDGKADFISLGRPLLADPYFPLKAEEGRPEDIIPCIRCNDGCLERTFFNYRSIRCSVNPTMGREGELPIIPAKSSKKIVVVGGGPAGLEAARVSALRGHQVTLFEKEELGGALVPGSAMPFKADIHNLIHYYQAQMEKLDIEIIREEATAEKIITGDYNAVILAVGGKSKPISYPGIDCDRILEAKDVLTAKEVIGNKAVVIGGSLTGIETALYLADRGCDVTVIEEKNTIMSSELLSFKISYQEMIGKQNITVYESAAIREIDNDEVVLVQASGVQTRIPADTIINASGYEADGKLANELKAKTMLEVHSIGDGKQLGRIYDAVHAGYLLGLRI